MRLFLNATLGCVLILSVNAWARPEYATKEKLNCASCHTTPWGGGPRVVFGKAYGARDLKSPKTNTTDLFYGDLRGIAYYASKRTTKTSNGLALMQASITGNAAVLEDSDGSELRAVLTYNMATLGGSGPREAYARWRFAGSTPDAATEVLIGRFYAPFGLLTDEHRTYTRIQTNMTLNNYDMGLGLSGNVTQDLHADLAVVNDFQTSGGFTTSNINWATVANVRWNPTALPFLLGVSGNYQYTLTSARPMASSVYAVVSLDKLTNDRISGSVQGERVDAFHWNNPVVNTGLVNPSLSQFFIPTSSAVYQRQTNDSPSLGYYAMAKYNLSQRWTLLYKLDYLALDKHAQRDNFTRHGFGLETFVASNAIVQARYEIATVPGQVGDEANVLAAQDDVFVMLRLSL